MRFCCAPCCLGEEHSHALPTRWLPGGSRIHGDGGSVGVLSCFGISSVACCPEPLSAQPGFRGQLSGYHRYLVMVSWKMGDLRAELPHIKFVFSLSLGMGTFLPICVVTRVSLYTGGVLPSPGHSSHTDAKGFLQPCGELCQGNDPIKNCVEQHQKQVLTRWFPNAA